MTHLPTIPGRDLPRIGWQHVARHLPEVVGPVTNGYPKPHGGVWTSPLRFDGKQVTGTGWTEWCTGENWGTPGAPITELHPNSDAAVYVINTADDLTAFAGAYTDPNGLHGVKMWAPIDWAGAAKGGIDAVWLTDSGQWATRFSQPGMYGWDCETVFWLNPAFTVGNIIDITGGNA